MNKNYRIKYLILKLNTVATFYFFALTQKSNKKSQGYEKMTKNYFVNPKPGELAAIFLYRQVTAGSNNAGFLTVYYVIFLTPFFRGQVSYHFENILPNLKYLL